MRSGEGYAWRGERSGEGYAVAGERGRERTRGEGYAWRAQLMGRVGSTIYSIARASNAWRGTGRGREGSARALPRATACACAPLPRARGLRVSLRVQQKPPIIGIIGTRTRRDIGFGFRFGKPNRKPKRPRFGAKIAPNRGLSCVLLPLPIHFGPE